MVRIEVAPIDGDKVGESNPHNIVLGQNQAVPDLEEKIMGLTPGETVDADVRFPDDHADEARRGQTRRVRVTLHEIKTQELPPLDDAFANEVGNFDTLASLKDAIRTDLGRDAERTADAQVRSALINELVTANSVPAPHSLVHRWLHAYAHQFGIDLMSTSTRRTGEVRGPVPRHRRGAGAPRPDHRGGGGEGEAAGDGSRDRRAHRRPRGRAERPRRATSTPSSRSRAG